MGSRKFSEAMVRMAFSEKVMVNSETGCHEWQGARGTNGYGVFRYQGRNQPAHRVMYEWVNGGVLPGMYILHKCDNRICVNPDHLVSGSPSDNARDMHAKRRHPRPNVQKRGEANSFSRLIEEQVVDIRRKRREGMTFQALANEYEVSEATIRKVVDGRTWSHLPGALTPEEVKSTRRYATGEANALGRWQRREP